MSNSYDPQPMLAGMRLVRKILSQPSMAPYVAEELEPGPKATSDMDMIDFMRRRGMSNNHAVGVCRMGKGPDAVVDPRLRVHGIEGLRVADASIMPTLTSGNTNAPSIMIGEKAARMILADAA